MMGSVFWKLFSLRRLSCDRVVVKTSRRSKTQCVTTAHIAPKTHTDTSIIIAGSFFVRQVVSVYVPRLESERGLE